MEEILKTEKTEQRPKKRAVFKHVLNILIYFAIVFGVLYGLPKFLVWSLKTTYPMAAITSGSMWPVLKEGDLVFIHGQIKKEDLRLGDIIVYSNKINNTLTIHRIARFNLDTLVTKGDANFTEDLPVPYTSVIGRAVTMFNGPIRIPHLGLITMFVNGLRTNAKNNN